MKKLLPTLVSLLFLVPLAGQVQLTAEYFPKVGDTLRTLIADSTYAAGLDQLTPGTDREWNFGTPVPVDFRAEAVESTEGDTLFPNADLKIRTAIFTQSYYQVSETEFNLVGIQSRLEIFPDYELTTAITPVRPIRRAPLSYQDIFNTETTNSVTLSPDSIPPAALALLGSILTGVDSIRITTTSTREDFADAYGTVIIGSKTYEVLREKRSESIYVKLEVKAAALPLWVDVTNLAVSQAPQIAGFLGQQTPTITYLYWNPGTIEPIAEFLTETETGTVLRLSYKEPVTSTSTGGPLLSQATISVFPNPATDLATFEMKGLDRGNYTLTLVNMVGRQLRTREFSSVGNLTRLSLDVSKLPQGMYLYNLRNAQGRTIATKRLLVR